MSGQLTTKIVTILSGSPWAIGESPDMRPLDHDELGTPLASVGCGIRPDVQKPKMWSMGVYNHYMSRRIHAS